MPGKQRTSVDWWATTARWTPRALAGLDGVPGTIITHPAVQAVSREWETREHHRAAARRAHDRGEDIVVMAGPCSVESESQIIEAARAGARCRRAVLRAAPSSPATSPYAFQGLGKKGPRAAERRRAKKTGLLIVTE